MRSVKTGKFLHHFQLTSLYLRIAQIVILILCPSRAHEHLHPVFRRSLHDCIHRTLSMGRILPRHKRRRIIGLTLVCYRHDDKIFHAHLMEFINLYLPHQRIRSVHIQRVGVSVPDILIRKIDETSCQRQYPITRNSRFRTL